MINRTLIVTSLRSQLSSRIRLSILALMALVGPIVGLFEHDWQPDPQHMLWLGWILGAGIIGRDLSTGVLQLIFVRPVKRSEYVINKYLALAAGTAAIALLQWALFLTFGRPDKPGLELLCGVLEFVLLAFGVSAGVIFLSSLVSGLGDLGILFLTYVSTQLVGFLGAKFQMPALNRMAGEVMGVFFPSIDLVGTFLHRTISWFSITSYFSSIALCLAVAMLVVNRREISYASN